MRKLHWLGILGLMAITFSGAWAQDDASTGTAPQQPVPAYGQDTTVPVSENPPISGLDIPTLEPHSAPLSYLQPGATVSESADSNVENGLGSGQTFQSVTRGIGSLALQRVWSHYQLAAQYEGGASYYNVSGIGWKTLQQIDGEQKISWKRGELSLRDSFSYLPEGNFGAAYGSLGSQNIVSLGQTSFSSFWGGANLGTLGLVSRVMNVALADVSENLSPKSAITATGGYALTHFYGTDQFGNHYLDNNEWSGQVGYDRILTPHTQIALVYGYQGFDFNSVGTAFHSHVIQGMYGHRISGRMDLLLAAGPQITDINLPGFVCSIPSLPPNLGCAIGGGVLNSTTLHDRRIGVAGMGRLRYRFPKTSLDLQYQRFETSGSGFFTGAQTDIAQLNLQRPLNRIWSAFADLGYSRNSRLAQLTSAQLGTCVYSGQSNPNGLPACPGVNAMTYSYGFVGFGVHRAFGHDFHGFASYQFNELAFDNSYCGGVANCSRIGNRNVITIGLDWTPRPIRID